MHDLEKQILEDQNVGYIKNLCGYLKLLDKEQIEFLMCLVLGFSEAEICKKLGIEKEKIVAIKTTIGETDKTNKLRGE